MKNEKERIMKNKMFGIIGVALVIGMAACASMSIVSVEWDTLEGPSKVRQYYNVPGTDVKVYANYKDGSRKQATMVTASLDKDNTGTQTVTVTVFGNGTGTFQTEVMEMTGIRVEKPPAKTTYTVGEEASLAGIRVMGIWRDFPDAEISYYEIKVASFNSSSAGTNRLVTVEYKGKTATFPVTVTLAPTPAPAAPATPAPAASQPAQQQPSQQQPAQPAFNPAANQPSPVGTWKGSQGVNTHFWTFNADGTGKVQVNSSSGGLDITWTTSGNRLTIIQTVGKTSVNYSYERIGNKLTVGIINSEGTLLGTIVFALQ
jgi:hypothetical protein